MKKTILILASIAILCLGGIAQAASPAPTNIPAVPEPSSLIAVGMPVLALGIAKLRQLRK